MRPLGVTVLALLYGIGGVLSLISGAMMLAIAPSLMKPFGMYEYMGGIMGGLSIMYFVFGAIGIVIAYGLWNLRNWARIAVIVLSVLGIIWSLGVISVMMGVSASLGISGVEVTVMSGIVGIAIYGAIIWYMLRVREAFS